MSQLFKCSKSKSHALDSHEYMKKENNLLDWKMPKIPTKKLYKRNNQFSFLFSDSSIKNREQIASLGNDNEPIRLIRKSFIPHIFIGKNHQNFNVGLVQIGVKTLTKKIPQNSSITLIVRDTRHGKFEDSILGLVESKNLGDGPLYFNVFPNITLSAFDADSFDVLVLHVIVKGFEKLPFGDEPISLTVRSVYKLQSDLTPSALLESPDGKTVFFQTHVEDQTNETVQKVTNWDEVIGNRVLTSKDEIKPKKSQSLLGV